MASVCQRLTRSHPRAPPPFLAAAVPDVEQNDYMAAVKTFAIGAVWAVGFDVIHRSIPFLCQRMGWWKRLPNERAKYEARAVRAWSPGRPARLQVNCNPRHGLPTASPIAGPGCRST